MPGANAGPPLFAVYHGVRVMGEDNLGSGECIELLYVFDVFFRLLENLVDTEMRFSWCPIRDLGFTVNNLPMMNAIPCKEYPTPVVGSSSEDVDVTVYVPSVDGR